MHTTIRKLYSETCKKLILLQAGFQEGKVGEFLRTYSAAELPENEADGSGHRWMDQPIESVENEASGSESPTDELLSAARNLEHLFDCSWEAGFRDEAQKYFYRTTKELFDAIEEDGYIPGREKNEDEDS